MQTKKPLIAIVDDDESMREAIKGLMRSLGFDAETFSSAEDYLGFPLLRSTTCLVTDIHMPGMSGLDLIELLRSRHFSAPAILITGDPSPSVRARASKACVPIVEKPLLGNALLRKIRDVAGDGRS